MTVSNENFLRADFAGRLGRLTDPVVGNFASIQDEDRNTTLTTIAFIFGTNDPLRLNTLGLQTSMLALYAAGAAVKMTRQELWAISAEVRCFADLYQLPEMKSNPNGQILHYVFNLAMQRAARESIPAGSRGELPEGFRPIRLNDAACSCSQEDDTERLLRTIAFSNLNPDPMQMNAPSLAVAMLAMWASGARVRLSKEQFKILRQPPELLCRLAARGSSRQAHRVREARLVLRHADARAQEEGLMEKPEAMVV